MYAMNCISLKKTAGERIFYLNSSSSQGLMKNTLCFRDLPRVRGESVCFMHQINAQDLALQIFKDYDAEVLFVERVGDVISYYGYAQGLGEVLCLDGYIINLHVAVTNERCVVGTPIIFGGF
jgi:hypothetical protein